MIEFDVLVVDGEGLAVPGVEVGVRYEYEASPNSWSAGVTDGDGHARFRDEHPEEPQDVRLFVLGEPCGTYPLSDGCHLTVEV